MKQIHRTGAVKNLTIIELKHSKKEADIIGPSGGFKKLNEEVLRYSNFDLTLNYLEMLLMVLTKRLSTKL